MTEDYYPDRFYEEIEESKSLFNLVKFREGEVVISHWTGVVYRVIKHGSWWTETEEVDTGFKEKWNNTANQSFLPLTDPQLKLFLRPTVKTP